MKILMPNCNGEISPVEIAFESTEAYTTLLNDVVWMFNVGDPSNERRAEFSARLSGLLAQARKEAFCKGADTFASVFGLPIQTEAEPIRPHV